MAFRVWTGSRWRRISDAEARFRRARGDEVVEGDVPERTPAAVVAAQPVVDLDATLPPMAQVAAVQEEPARVTRKCSLCGEPGHNKSTCPLAELEKLTAPSSVPES